MGIGYAPQSPAPQELHVRHPLRVLLAALAFAAPAAVRADEAIKVGALLAMTGPAVRLQYAAEGQPRRREDLPADEADGDLEDRRPLQQHRLREGGQGADREARAGARSEERRV